MEVYESSGDAEAALRAIVGEGGSGEQSPRDEYNALLLLALATKSSLHDESLEDIRTVVAKTASRNLSGGGSRGRALADDWILAFNRGLVLLSKGEAEESIALAWSYLEPVVASTTSGGNGGLSQQQQQQKQPPLELACRMGFLVLEGMLALYPTRIHGHASTGTGTSRSFRSGDGCSFDLGLLDTVLAWVEEHVELTRAPAHPVPAAHASESSSSNNNSNNNNAHHHGSTTGGPDPQLKFLLSLYQSRVNFFERTTEDAATRDKHMRSARKELKQAMETFQHKLRPERSDTASVGTFSSYSEEVANANTNANAGASGGTATTDGKQSPVALHSMAPSPGLAKNHSSLSRILQSQNQAALNLKANAEQLKGNLKKALILCGEAQSFNNNNSSNNNNYYYEAIHQNNLGIVYESSGKSHLALHAFSKAVRSATERRAGCGSGSRFEQDGTATPDVTLHVLNNAAICALKSGNYPAAYECYAIGLATARSWKKRPRTWLRLSEACIGINARARAERTKASGRCSRVEVDGRASGILLTDTWKTASDGQATNADQQELPALASPDDLKDIRNHAVKRALMALKTALKLFAENGTKPDDLALQSARLSFAYMSLEDNDFKTALKYSMLVLTHSKPDEPGTKGDGEEDPSESARRILIKRQAATARMYASEANASLGDPMASMKVLVGDGKDDAFDRLSSDLGGVTLGMASANHNAKARLAKAQTMVRCSASAATAALGNLTASKQLAMSAQAMENSYSSSREGTSQARKALIYCMLREGNHGAALNLLRSAH